LGRKTAELPNEESAVNSTFMFRSLYRRWASVPPSFSIYREGNYNSIRQWDIRKARRAGDDAYDKT
jgi:hypothetical protein